MTKEYSITGLREDHIPHVLRISRLELGDDYLDRSDLMACLGSKDGYFCRVILDDQGIVAGFGKGMVVGPEPADAFLKLPPSGARDSLLSKAGIGIMDAAAVDRARQRAGLGRMVVRSVHDTLIGEKPDVICAMAWQTIHGVINAGKLLAELGLEESISIEGYWNLVTDSPEGHHCPVCDGPPCRCHGVLYTKYLAGR